MYFLPFFCAVSSHLWLFSCLCSVWRVWNISELCFLVRCRAEFDFIIITKSMQVKFTQLKKTQWCSSSWYRNSYIGFYRFFSVGFFFFCPRFDSYSISWNYFFFLLVLFLKKKNHSDLSKSTSKHLYLFIVSEKFLQIKGERWGGKEGREANNKKSWDQTSLPSPFVQCM